MSKAESIEQKLRGALAPAHLEIVNESHMHAARQAESHFKVLVVSEAFDGQSRVQRQRRVHELLEVELKGGVHALSLRLLTPSEWQEPVAKNFESPVCHSKKSKA